MLVFRSARPPGPSLTLLMSRSGPCPHPALRPPSPRGRRTNARAGPLPLREGGRRPGEGKLAETFIPLLIGEARYTGATLPRESFGRHPEAAQTAKDLGWQRVAHSEILRCLRSSG